MKCYTCHTEMKSVDDILCETYQETVYRCPKCNSYARMDHTGGFPRRVDWRRDYKWSKEVEK